MGALDRPVGPALGQGVDAARLRPAESAEEVIRIFGNQLDALPKSYSRYLVNGLRDGKEVKLAKGTTSETFTPPGISIGCLPIRLMCSS